MQLNEKLSSLFKGEDGGRFLVLSKRQRQMAKTKTEVAGSQLCTPKPCSHPHYGKFSALETPNSEVQLSHVQNPV